MKLFKIAQGTQVYVVKPGEEFSHNNLHRHTTQHEQIFELEEVSIDPTGVSEWAAGPQHLKTIGGYYAKAGYWGFDRDGWTVLAPYTAVEML